MSNISGTKFCSQTFTGEWLTSSQRLPIDFISMSTCFGNSIHYMFIFPFFYILLTWCSKIVIDFSRQYVNSSGIVLCLKIGELKTLSVYIYIFGVVSGDILSMVMMKYSYQMQEIFKQNYLTHSWDPNRYYHFKTEWI